MANELVDLELDLKHQTDKAYLVSDGKIEVWLPKAIVERDGNTFTMPYSYAFDKGLI